MGIHFKFSAWGILAIAALLAVLAMTGGQFAQVFMNLVSLIVVGFLGYMFLNLILRHSH